jgi:hypothetical protein
MPDRRRFNRRMDKPRRAGDRRKHLLDRLSVLGFAIAITIGWFSLQHQANEIKQSRIENTEQRCKTITAVIDSAHALGVPRQSPDIKALVDLQEECNRLLEQYRADS